MRTGQNIYKRRDGRWEARIPLGIDVYKRQAEGSSTLLTVMVLITAVSRFCPSSFSNTAVR